MSLRVPLRSGLRQHGAVLRTGCLIRRARRFYTVLLSKIRDLVTWTSLLLR